jgi:hypothetical protein
MYYKLLSVVRTIVNNFKISKEDSAMKDLIEFLQYYLMKFTKDKASTNKDGAYDLIKLNTREYKRCKKLFKEFLYNYPNLLEKVGRDGLGTHYFGVLNCCIETTKYRIDETPKNVKIYMLIPRSEYKLSANNIREDIYLSMLIDNKIEISIDFLLSTTKRVVNIIPINSYTLQRYQWLENTKRDI